MLQTTADSTIEKKVLLWIQTKDIEKSFLLSPLSAFASFYIS